ncbi:hypothetical protein [Sphingomonas sp. KR3-1]|uniref:hypothetical protein n=1 Tax=Sphingomonas sp. KR3-1 TaxID=3156611 RepID=UPI0032B3F420
MLRSLLAVLLLALPMAAQADWHEASTGHFIVYSEQKPEALKAFARELEQFDKGVRTLLKLPDPPIDRANRVTVYVVDDRGDVARLAKDKFVAGFYKPLAGGSFAVVPRRAGQGDALSLDPQSILLHEYAHHIMHSMSPNAAYPTWLIEGFAEFYATAGFGRDGSITFGAPPLYRGAGLMQGNALPVEKMLMADTLKLSENERAGLYGRGWLLTHYLMIGADQRSTQLGAYVAAINAGKKPMEAARIFGDLATLDRELERYKMGRFRIVRLGGSQITIGDIAIRALTPGEAATMDVRIRAKAGVDPAAAPEIYAAAQKAAAPYPKDAAAQVVLAEAAFAARDLAGAEAAADRAIAADPKAIDGYVYKAKCQMARARAAKDVSAATWDAIRTTIATGNRLDPQDPEPLILYYQSYRAQRLKPSENAMDGLYSAFSYAPQDPSLRMLTATMFLRRREPATARTLLAPLAYQPHAGALVTLATALLAKIDAGDIDGAIATLNGRAVEKKPED